MVSVPQSEGVAGRELMFPCTSTYWGGEVKTALDANVMMR